MSVYMIHDLSIDIMCIYIYECVHSMYINRFHAFCILPSPSNAAHWWSTESFCKIRNKSQIAENAQQFHCNRTPCSRCSWLTGSFVKRYDFSYLRVGGFKAPEKYANMFWDHEDGKSVRPPLTRLTFASNSALIRLQCLRANPNLSSDNLHPHLSSWGFNKVNDQASKMGHNDLVFSIRITKILRGIPTLEKWLCLIRVPKIISGWSWLIVMSNSHCHWRITNENWPTIPAAPIEPWKIHWYHPMKYWERKPLKGVVIYCDYLQ